MDYVLGIDIGTGSIKAVAVDLQGRSFQDCQQLYGYSAPKPGYYEQDPEQIWGAFKLSIKGVVDKIGSKPLAVSLSSAMHSLVVVDENGRSLAPMMTWADNRSAKIATELRATPKGMEIYKATGTPIHTMSPLCKIIWINEHDPELFAEAFKFISIKEFIWYKLFAEFVIDHSIASCTGLFDINRRVWYGDALELAHITPLMLSEPVSTGYSKNFSPGKGNPELDCLKEGTPFIVGASDGCLANLGTGADKPGIAAITIGTSGAVRVASSKPLPNINSMPFSYVLDEKTFICGGPVNNGGVALQWWLKNTGRTQLSTKDYEQLFEQIAAVLPGSNGLLFLPYLTGERAPLWDSESCGTFFGIKLRHIQPDFSRAVLEGICYALKDVLDAVEENAEPVVQINVSGGFTRSDVWVQMLADIIGKNLAVMQTDDASAVGAALLALRYIGAVSYENALASAGQKMYKPNAGNGILYKETFSIFKQLYRDLKETMHRLYKMSS